MTSSLSHDDTDFVGGKSPLYFGAKEATSSQSHSTAASRVIWSESRGLASTSCYAAAPTGDDNASTASAISAGTA